MNESINNKILKDVDLINKKYSFWHPNYGKIIYPYYNKNSIIYDRLPEIYNKDGEKMEVVFLRDKCGAHLPYLDCPTQIFFDRFNFSLNKHIYTNECMLEIVANPQNRYLSMIETPSIVPWQYEYLLSNRHIADNFDYIFTYDERILNSFSNARFVQWFACPLYKQYENDISQLLLKKNKIVSILSSNKTMCEQHKIRISFANILKQNRLADTYGTFDGGGYASLDEVLTPYRFNVCIENYISDYMFSERLSDCFASLTIPVYFGAKKISEFFNEDGIIFISENTDIAKCVKTLCTKEFYDDHIEAVIDNYNRIKKYHKSPWDYLYKTYMR